jgi:hypothetical protein
MCAKDACHILYDSSFSRALGSIGGVDEYRDRGGWRHQVVHQLKAFCEQINSEDRDACDVAAGMGEARDETDLDWIGTNKNTIGIICVAALAASAPGVLAPTTITATSR